MINCKISIVNNFFPTKGLYKRLIVVNKKYFIMKIYHFYTFKEFEINIKSKLKYTDTITL